MVLALLVSTLMLGRQPTTTTSQPTTTTTGHPTVPTTTTTVRRARTTTTVRHTAPIPKNGANQYVGADHGAAIHFHLDHNVLDAAVSINHVIADVDVGRTDEHYEQHSRDRQDCGRDEESRR